MTQQTEEQVRAALVASLLTQRTGGRSGNGAAPRRGLGKRLIEAPPPPPTVSHPILAAELVAFAGAAAHWADVAPWWFVAGGGASAVTTAVMTHTRFQHKPATLLAAASSLAAGGAVAVGAQFGAPEALGAAGFGALVLGPLYAAAHRRHDKRHEAERKHFEEIRAERKRDEIEEILRLAGLTDVRVVRELNGEATLPSGEQVTWTNGERQLPAAYALALELGDKAPDPSVLPSMTSKLEPKIARRLRLPIRAGSVQLRPRGYADQWELIVPTRDLMLEEVPFVLEDGPRSINDLIYVAMVNDGTALGVDFMETPHGMWAGMTGYGKTTFLHAHLCETTRCTDAVNWVITGKKPHRLLRPWFEAFLRGTPSTTSGTGYVEPVLDWFATEIDEACMMLADVYKAIFARQATAADDDAGEKWVPDPDHPRIIVWIDEPSRFLKDKTYRIKPFDWPGSPDEDGGWTFSELLVEVITAARSEGISIVFMVQRGTHDLGGDHLSVLKSQIPYRVSFHQQGALEQSKTFSSSTAGIDVTKLARGEIYAEVGDVARPVLAKGYYPSWDDIRQASVAHTAYQQPLDPRTAENLDFYGERWTRPGQQEFLRSLVTNPVRTVPGQSAQRSTPAPEQSAQQVPDVPRSVAEDQLRQSAEDLDTSVEALQAMLPELADLDDNGIPDDQEPASPIPWGARFDPTLHEYTRALLDVIASSDLLRADWVPTRDILAEVARWLPDWPQDATEGGRRVKWALEQAGVEQPSDPPRIPGSRKRMPRGYFARDILLAIDRFIRPGDDSGPAE